MNKLGNEELILFGAAQTSVFQWIIRNYAANIKFIINNTFSILQYGIMVKDMPYAIIGQAGEIIWKTIGMNLNTAN